MTFQGRARWRPVEGGTWVLEAADAEYVLLGEVPKALDGQWVEVEGEEVGTFGFAMAGPQIEVRRIRATGR